MTFQLDWLSVDSEVFGIDAWSLSSVESGADFARAIEALGGREATSLVTCKLPIDAIDHIHAAEQAGFRFLETQLRTTLRISGSFDTTKYPYKYVQVRTLEQLEQAVELARRSIVHDRFSRDPLIGQELSGQRYARLLRNSFECDDEEIWCVESLKTGQLLTFRSHKVVDGVNVTLLLGGVHADFRDSGLGVISSHFCFNQLSEAGFKKVNTVISTTNLPIVNLEVGHFGFRVVETLAVLRAVV